MDWDQDGKQDILSGSYLTKGVNAGHLQFLRGVDGFSFEAAKTMVDVDGKPLENVSADDVPDKLERRLLNLCTHQHAVDYDNDGDLDLVVGSNMDEFFLHENVASDSQQSEGSQTSNPSVNTFTNKAIPLQVRLPDPARHAAPHLADWDNDGDLDLLSGSSMGGVFIAENEGSKDEPKWGPCKMLIGPRADASNSVDRNDPRFQMGGSTRVWATDFNADGLLDLLVGDHCEVDVNAASESATQLESTGFVWLFIRKPSHASHLGDNPGP